jgi:hypothetical protein
MNPKELEAPVDGDVVDELKDWSSLWADLLHVEMSLHTRAGIPDNPANLFARRALWEAAVITYGRTANSGRRQQQIEGLVTALGSAAEKCHQEILTWRDKHVAHRVDELREKVDVRVVIDTEESRLKRIAVRVAPVLGPEEEASDLAASFHEHVRALKERVWRERIQLLEKKVLEEHADRADDLLEIAKPAAPTDSHFAIDISPSGGSRG